MAIGSTDHTLTSTSHALYRPKLRLAHILMQMLLKCYEMGLQYFDKLSFHHFWASIGLQFPKLSLFSLNLAILIENPLFRGTWVLWTGFGKSSMF